MAILINNRNQANQWPLGSISERNRVMKIRWFFVLLVLTTITLPTAALAQTEYLAVFMEGRKVGYAIQSRDVANGKVTTTEDVSMTISRGGMQMAIKMTETSIETADGEPLGFMAVQNISMMETKTVGVVNKNGTMDVTVFSMGGQQKDTREWPKGAMMAEGLRLLTLKKGLKEGTKYLAKVFSPGSMQAIDAQVRIGAKQNVDLLGRVVKLRKVETVMMVPGAGEIVTVSYVDDDLRTQKCVLPVAGMQIEMVACAKDFAMGQIEVFELADKMFVSSPEPLEDVASAKAISYHLKPTSTGGKLTIPSGDNQKAKQLEDGGVILVVSPVEAAKKVRFPYKGRDEEILAATEPSIYLQSDRKEIIELARRAVGKSKDAAEAVRKIESFVAEYIENKNLSVGYASAAEVATSRQGDCTEFAVLTAAMCRAVGIPAQGVVGVAYVEDFIGRQGFGGHAWIQAYIGDRWVGFDSAFKGSGRGGYDAGHIALAAGDGEPMDFFNLVTMLGAFEIDKVVVNK